MGILVVSFQALAVVQEHAQATLLSAFLVKSCSFRASFTGRHGRPEFSYRSCAEIVCYGGPTRNYLPISTEGSEREASDSAHFPRGGRVSLSVDTIN